MSLRHPIGEGDAMHRQRLHVPHSVVTRRSLLKWAGSTAACTAVAGTAGCANTATARPPADTGNLFFTDTGQGRNVLFLHGWGCDSHDWSWQLPAFQTQYRTLSPDLRGHGRSPVFPSGAYQPEHFVADIEALMLKHGRDGKFVLVGHSMGGQIAARLAAQRPDLVQGVVSIDGAIGWDGAVVDFFLRTSQAMQHSEQPAQAAIAMIDTVYGPDTDPATKVWHARRLQGMAPHVLRESFAPLFFGPGQVGAGQASRAFCESLTVPVLHLSTDPATVARMRPWFKHPLSHVDAAPSAGHWIMVDRPRLVNTFVAAWIDRLPGT